MEHLCDLCRGAITAVVRDGQYGHQPSLAALKSSANSCSFCNLIWHSLVLACTPEALAVQLKGRLYGHEDEANTVIQLRGNFTDHVSSEFGTPILESNITVLSGICEENDSDILYSTLGFGELRLFSKAGKTCSI